MRDKGAGHTTEQGSKLSVENTRGIACIFNHFPQFLLQFALNFTCGHSI